MTRSLGVPFDVGKKSEKPVPAVAYGRYLERLAKGAGLDKHGLVALTGLSYQMIHRNLAGDPHRSMISMNKIRAALVKKGLDVEAVPNEEDGWIDPIDRPVSSPRRHPELDEQQEVFRRNLVLFGEQAGFLDLHERSKATGIAFETLRAYELGNAQVSGQHLLAIARSYGRDPNHFDLEDPPPPDRRPAPAVHAQIVGSLDDMLPENRRRALELQREAAAINAAEREHYEAQRAKPSKRR
jgi:transcriptional regulator with XRE-family HTH domain